MTTPDMEGFSQRMFDLRHANDMSLDDVAKASGMTKSHIWEMEQGRARNPTVRAVWGIARALGTTPAYMLGIDPHTPAIDPLAVRVAAIINAELQERGQ